MTPEALFKALEHVKLGGSTCLYTPEKCEELAPLINQIQALKKEKNAIVLAHSYVSPEMLCGVADFVGDSYELSKKARESDADVIVFAAVRFMAETAKLLSPTKQVLIPGKDNGCSLADSITGDDVRALRKQYPDYTFVCYINTTADVKAECDICVTSSNVYKIIEAIPNNNIYFLPDKLMAKNVINALKEKGVEKNILYWSGTCYVHEEYDADMVHYIRSQYPGVKVLTHPECDESVLLASDYVGSTSQMVNFVNTTHADSFFMLTECGLTSRLQTENPSKKFVGTCTMCRYMKSNTLYDIIRVLSQPQEQDIIRIDPEIATRAIGCIDRMFTFPLN